MSLGKKVKSVIQHGIDPIKEGMTNYKKNIPEVEKLANKRIETLLKSKCANFVDEPIPMFRVEDKRIPKASNKMCDDCGCAVPYLIRQDLKKCPCWEE